MTGGAWGGIVAAEITALRTSAFMWPASNNLSLQPILPPPFGTVHPRFSSPLAECSWEETHMLNIKMLAWAALAILSSLSATSPTAAQVVEGEEHCVVNVKASDRLNVRESDSASSQIVTKLRYGQCGVVVVAECKNNWCPIEDGHFAGWVNRRYISMVSPARYCVAGVSAGDVLNVRAFPSPSSRIITGLPSNKCGLAFLPYATGGWQKVRVSGYEGWVNGEFLSGQ